MRKHILADILAILLIILFTYAATSKLLDYSNSVLQMQRSPFITQWAGILGWAVPLVELLISCALVFSVTRRAGFYGSFLLMLLFTGYIYAMLHYSPFLPCSCGGVLAAMTWQQHLYFNVIFVLVAAAGILLSAKKQLARPDSPTSLNPAR